MDGHNEADCAKTLKKEQMASLQNNRIMAPRESTAGQSLSGKKKLDARFSLMCHRTLAETAGQ